MTQPDRTEEDGRIVVRPGETRVVGAGHPAEPAPRRWQEPEPNDRQAERLRSEIGATRAQMSETIDAIQERLSPDHVGEQVQEHVQRVAEQVKAQVREATIGRVENMIADARDTAVDARDGFIDRIRENPVPAAIAGLGLAWLFMSDSGRSRRRTTAYRGRRTPRFYYRPEEREEDTGYEARYVERYPADAGRREGMVDQAREVFGGVAGTARDAVGGVAGTARDTVGGVAGQAREVVGSAAEQARMQAEQLAREAAERAGDVAEEAERQARMARYRFEDELKSSPLALGAIALGIGAAVGLAVPSTERENELLGETRDRLMARAREVVGEAGEELREQAGDMLGESGSSSGQHSAGVRSPVRTGV